MENLEEQKERKTGALADSMRTILKKDYHYMQSHTEDIAIDQIILLSAYA